MAENLIARHSSRRDGASRRHRAADSVEAKRRSKSEGPIRRVRQSMDEREERGRRDNRVKGYYDNQLQDSLESDSGEEAFPKAHVESDSDSDRQKWVKNPLVVRRTKRSDKNRSLEKRHSVTDFSKNSQQAAAGKEDDHGSSGGGNSSSRDGTSSRSSQRFQKLEEMRKKRINMTVTSDEESTPASRISRLRQRAIQSGLGDQPHSMYSQAANENRDFGRDSYRVQQFPKFLNNPPNTAGESSVHLRPKNRTSQAPVLLQNQKHTANEDPFPASNHFNRSYKFPASHNSGSNIQQQQSGNAHPGRVQDSPNKRPGSIPQAFSSQTKPDPSHRQSAVPVQRVVVASNSSPTQAHHPPFHTIPDHHPHSSRVLYNSSPDINKRRHMPQIRIPSADSVYDTPAVPAVQESGYSKRATQKPNQSPVISHVSGSCNRNQHYDNYHSSENHPIANRASQVEIDRSKMHKIPKSIIPQILANSEDSLDELIESNIQYLDREIDKAKAKRLAQASSSAASKQTVYTANNAVYQEPTLMTSSMTPSFNQPDKPVIKVQQNSSVQLRVALGSTPAIRKVQSFGPGDQLARPSSVRFGGSQEITNADSRLHRQPEVVSVSGHKSHYDSTPWLLRPEFDHLARDDLSKSDSQLNAPVFVPKPLLTTGSFNPDQAYARGCISDVNLTAVSKLEVPLVEKGMFSDADYDIEVSERVRKWEKYMKKPQKEGARKPVQLTTISEGERQGGEGLMLPSEVRKSVLLSKHNFQDLDNEQSEENNSERENSWMMVPLGKEKQTAPQNVLTIETNAKRFFNVIQDPQTGPRLRLESQNLSSVVEAPINIHLDKTQSNSSDIFPPYFSRRNPNRLSGQEPARPVPTQLALPCVESNDSQSPSQYDSSPVLKRSHLLVSARDPADRSSRYQEELQEISSVKDSVVNLRRRFDPDSAAPTSEDDQKSVVSTASARLLRQSKLSPKMDDIDPVDLFSMIPGYSSKLKESDVWSPNLESTTGVPVSIERVKARTLQTIPFSEDPFWKEIEEMTSFDPNSVTGSLAVAGAQNPDLIKPQSCELAMSSQSSTLPSQPKQSVSSKDRLQRSKSLYTPNIIPLSINVEKPQTNVSNPFNEILDDIKSSMERQQRLSPKKRSTDKHMWSSVDLNKDYHENNSRLSFINPSSDNPQQPTRSIAHMKVENIALPSKQPLQFYQQQQQQAKDSQPPAQQRFSQNYQLDPNLLKQKLLKTGLVVETDTEDGPAASSSCQDLSSMASKPSTPSWHIHTSSTAAPNQNNISSLSAPQSRKESILSKMGVQSGSNALDDIQRALANFKSSSHPSGAESLYGTSEFKSFADQSGTDTTRGPNTKSTGWTYQPQQKQEDLPKPSVPLVNKSQKLKEVNESMDDLQKLAQSVESQINTIKSKLQAADENSLDSVLSSLKKFTPDSKYSQETPESFEEHYSRKKNKLSHALSELDRIHASLDLKHESPNTSTASLIPPQPKSEHLRPMQMRVSSMYIAAPQSQESEAVDKEVESEFDVISKSFKAIIDEVNKTSNLLSASNPDMTDKRQKGDDGKNEADVSKQAPETQKQTFMITLQNKDKHNTDNAMNSSPVSHAQPQVAPKPQLTKMNNTKMRQQIVPEAPEKVKLKTIGYNPPQNEKESDRVEQPVVPKLDSPVEGQGHPVDKVKNVVGGTTSSTPSTPPLSRIRARARPVKDNKIIQEDRAIRKDSSRVLGMPPSPQPSPKISRRIVFNNGNNLDIKLDPPTMFQDSKEEEKPYKPETKDKVTELNDNSKQEVKEEQLGQKSTTSNDFDTSKIELVSSAPATQTKIPPPTLAKPANRSLPVSSPSQIPVLASKSTASVPPESPSSPSKLTANLTVNISRPNSAEQSAATTTGNSVVTSPEESKQHQLKTSKENKNKKDSDPAGEANSSKSKRLVGSGVALMMDKFQKSDGEGGAESPTVGSNNKSTKESTALAERKTRPGGGLKPKSSLPERKPKPVGKQSVGGKTVGTAKTPGNNPTEVKDKMDPKKKLTFTTESKVVDSHEKQPEESSPSLPSSPSIKAALKPLKCPAPSDANDQNPSDSSPTSQQPKGDQTGGNNNQENVVAWHKTYDTPKATKKLTPLKATTDKVPQNIDIKVLASERKNSPTQQGTQLSESKIRALLPSPKSVRRRIRPTHRKIQTESLSNPGSSGEENFKRPHSFHELDSSQLGLMANENDSSIQLRKFLSAEKIQPDASASTVFRSFHEMGEVSTRGKTDQESRRDEGNVTA